MPLKEQNLYKPTTLINICSIFVPFFKDENMKERNTYLSSASVKKQGRTAYYKMLESAKQGELIQVRRGVYANIDQLSGNMIDINAVVPDSILCLWSAWSIHQGYLNRPTSVDFPTCLGPANICMKRLGSRMRSRSV